MNDILSMSYEELCSFAAEELKIPVFRAKQISEWLVKGAYYDEMTNLPAELRERLKSETKLFYPTVAGKLVSKIDGTIKYLMQLSDGNCVECVLMDYEHGTTICISTQVGCRMGCKFCASTIGGKIRDLEPSEMLGQIITAEKDSGKKVSGVVMMGIGEPLDNYDNCIKFIRLISSDKGLNIGQRHISLSTSGLADKIRMLAKEDLQITLSISLHAYDDEVRSSIMPVNNKWNIDSLLTACRDYFDETGRRISFEYTLISGKNDSKEGAQKLTILLKKYFGKRPLHVNLIPVNEVSETGFKRSAREAVNSFAEMLCKYGVNATVRRRLGSDINAACGQLRRENINSNQTREGL